MTNASTRSPLNPPAGAFLHGLKFLSNNVLIWWFWCLSGTQSTWQKELLTEIAWIICIWWKPNLRSFCSLFPLDYVVKWGLRQPARRREWRVIVAVDLLGDFSHKWVKSCVTKLLFVYFIFPSFLCRFGQVWLQFVYRFWRVFMNVRKIAGPMANFTFCQKVRKSVADFPCSHLGSLGYDVKPFPVHKPGLIWVTCCSRRFPRLVPAVLRGTWWS